MIGAVLCDLDGTLVDSVSELRLAVNRARKVYGLPVASLDQVRGWVGEGLEMLLRRSLADALRGASDEAILRDARERFDAAYADVLGSEAVLFPGVAEGLARLQAATVPLACVTNKPERFARMLLESRGILEAMTLVVGGDTAPARKPDAAAIRFAAERLGVGIADCVMVGDSAVDVAAARNAGCRAWCVRGGYDRGQPVDTLGADAVFDRFDELVTALLAAEAAT